jgi:hypothetical protein
MATTVYKLADECARIIYGGNIPDAGKVHIEELKNAVCQVANQLLKTEYFQINGKIGETIPNGTMLALYENIAVTKYKNVSQAILPVMPVKLPRNMGVFMIFDPENPAFEFIPLQMGQWGLLQSQPLINDLLGQCGYEPFGMQILFTKDITNNDPLNPTTVSMRLAILDIAQYGDYDPLPVLPEMEFVIKQQVCAMYGAELVADKIVDAGHKEQKGTPINQQTQP